MVDAASSWCCLACRHTPPISLPPCHITSFLSLCLLFSADIKTLIRSRHHLIKYGLISTVTLITSVKTLIPNKVRHSEVLGRHELWGNIIIQPTPWLKKGQPNSLSLENWKNRTLSATHSFHLQNSGVWPLALVIDIAEISLVPFAWVSYYSESPSFCAWPNISPITPHVT